MPADPSRLPPPSGRIHLHPTRNAMMIHIIRTCPACGKSFCSHCYPPRLHTPCPEATNHDRVATQQ